MHKRPTRLLLQPKISTTSQYSARTTSYHNFYANITDTNILMLARCSVIGSYYKRSIFLLIYIVKKYCRVCWVCSKVEKPKQNKNLRHIHKYLMVLKNCCPVHTYIKFFIANFLTTRLINYFFSAF